MIEEFKQALTRKGISKFLFFFAMLEMPNPTTWFITPEIHEAWPRATLFTALWRDCRRSILQRRSSDENLRTIALNIRLSVFEEENNVGKL
jgi:hypothetical protein